MELTRKIIGFNLVSENCKESALVYSKLLNLEILKANEFHAELKLNEELLLYFNKPSKECFVEKGSLTIYLKESEIQNNPFFVLEQSIEGKYKSYLDKYGNRIWILDSTKE
ncbi:MAG: hypothetical protein N3A69_05885 [Leptospiraceae bacterium]|nr:hypothetical protein [Leptospiraceae bacterium]